MSRRVIERTSEEIDDLLNRVMNAVDKGERRFPGMSFEEGVEQGIKWVLGEQDDDPYPEE